MLEVITAAQLCHSHPFIITVSSLSFFSITPSVSFSDQFLLFSFISLFYFSVSHSVNVLFPDEFFSLFLLLLFISIQAFIALITFLFYCVCFLLLHFILTLISFCPSVSFDFTLFTSSCHSSLLKWVRILHSFLHSFLNFLPSFLSLFLPSYRTPLWVLQRKLV